MTELRLEYFALGCFALVLIVMVISFTVISKAAFNSDRVGAPKSLGLLFQRIGALRILTVFMVLLALIILALLSKLDDGAIAILGSVAGYALGGMDGRREQPRLEPVGD